MKTLWNEGRVVGLSAYELYVQQAISKDAGSEDVASINEWLASTLGSGASMILKVSTDNIDGYHIRKFQLPHETSLCAANVIFASYFDGIPYVNNQSIWGTAIGSYGSTALNKPGSGKHPSVGNSLPPEGTSEDQVVDRPAKLNSYAKIIDGVVVQPGIWEENSSESADNPEMNLIDPIFDENGIKYPPELRIAFKGKVETEFFILLTGFTDRNIVKYISEVASGKDPSKPASSHPENGDFLGPAMFPWASKVVFSLPTSISESTEFSKNVVDSGLSISAGPGILVDISEQDGKTNYEISNSSMVDSYITLQPDVDYRSAWFNSLESDYQYGDPDLVGKPTGFFCADPQSINDRDLSNVSLLYKGTTMKKGKRGHLTVQVGVSLKNPSVLRGNPLTLALLRGESVNGVKLTSDDVSIVTIKISTNSTTNSLQSSVPLTTNNGMNYSNKMYMKHAGNVGAFPSSRISNITFKNYLDIDFDSDLDSHTSINLQSVLTDYLNNVVHVVPYEGLKVRNSASGDNFKHVWEYYPSGAYTQVSTASKPDDWDENYNKNYYIKDSEGSYIKNSESDWNTAVATATSGGNQGIWLSSLDIHDLGVGGDSVVPNSILNFLNSASNIRTLIRSSGIITGLWNIGSYTIPGPYNPNNINKCGASWYGSCELLAEDKSWYGAGERAQENYLMTGMPATSTTHAPLRWDGLMIVLSQYSDGFNQQFHSLLRHIKKIYDSGSDTVDALWISQNMNLTCEYVIYKESNPQS